MTTTADFIAEVICDSYGSVAPRLTTFRLRYPKMIHGEFMTHRMFGRNAGSSRAIPVATLLKVSIDEMYVPTFYDNQKGMQGGAAFDADRQSDAEDIWVQMAHDCADGVRRLAELGAHKGHANRPLEWFGWIEVVATATEDAWLNFFGLRLHEAAFPEIRALAMKMWAAWTASEPRRLEPGQWHLPFVTGRNEAEAETMMDQLLPPGNAYGLTPHEQMIRVSVARCAHTSYVSHGTRKRSTVEECLAVYAKLNLTGDDPAAPLHASPAEHQATPDSDAFIGRITDQMKRDGGWLLSPNRHLWGNLPGWVQYRKMLPGERVAPLPAGYEYRWRRP